MLLKISSERNSEESIRYAPVLQHIKSEYGTIILLFVKFPSLSLSASTQILYTIYINAIFLTYRYYICYAESFNSLECNLLIDALSLVNLNVKSAELHAILVESICRNIRLIEMQQENQSEDIKPFTLPEIMHFKPQGCGHLFTVVYPGNSTNDNTSKISYLDYICLLSIMFINFITIEFCIICNNILYHHCIINIIKTLSTFNHM